MKIDDTMKSCLRCTHFKLVDLQTGRCRKEKGGEYPLQQLMDTCQDWKDCGQNYFIRKGWIKAQKQKH